MSIFLRYLKKVDKLFICKLMIGKDWHNAVIISDLLFDVIEIVIHIRNMQIFEYRVGFVT